MDKIVLPRKDKEGLPYCSYSQLKLWNDTKGYNTGRLGKEEFIRSYFLGEQYPDTGYAQFGTEVEAYICNRQFAENFTAEEQHALSKITPLGVLQHEFKMQFPGFYLKGFIDDATPDFTKLRDYKTCSLASSKQYYNTDYKQLDLYSLAVEQEFGQLPLELEVCAIERTGNAFRGGRVVLQVGKNIWYIPRTTTQESRNQLYTYIVDTVTDISNHYKAFLKLNTLC